MLPALHGVGGGEGGAGAHGGASDNPLRIKRGRGGDRY